MGAGGKVNCVVISCARGWGSTFLVSVLCGAVSVPAGSFASRSLRQQSASEFAPSSHEDLQCLRLRVFESTTVPVCIYHEKCTEITVAAKSQSAKVAGNQEHRQPVIDHARHLHFTSSLLWLCSAAP